MFKKHYNWSFSILFLFLRTESYRSEIRWPRIRNSKILFIRFIHFFLSHSQRERCLKSSSSCSGWTLEAHVQSSSVKKKFPTKPHFQFQLHILFCETFSQILSTFLTFKAFKNEFADLNGEAFFWLKKDSQFKSPVKMTLVGFGTHWQFRNLHSTRPNYFPVYFFLACAVATWSGRKLNTNNYVSLSQLHDWHLFLLWGTALERVSAREEAQRKHHHRQKVVLKRKIIRKTATMEKLSFFLIFFLLLKRFRTEVSWRSDPE